MADAHDSKSCSARSAGSTPALGTNSKFEKNKVVSLVLLLVVHYFFLFTFLESVIFATIVSCVNILNMDRVRAIICIDNNYWGITFLI